jgi:hypothetical protein
MMASMWASIYVRTSEISVIVNTQNLRVHNEFVYIFICVIVQAKNFHVLKF